MNLQVFLAFALAADAFPALEGPIFLDFELIFLSVFPFTGWDTCSVRLQVTWDITVALYGVNVGTFPHGEIVGKTGEKAGQKIGQALESLPCNIWKNRKAVD